MLYSCHGFALAFGRMRQKDVECIRKGTSHGYAYFCPVGTAFSSDYIEIGTDFNGSVSANNLTTNEILQEANVYSNHGGEIIFRVSHHRVTEDWEINLH